LPEWPHWQLTNALRSRTPVPWGDALGHRGEVMRAVVTGAAGFVGSHLCMRLLEQGYDVLGIDAMTDFYDVAYKEANLAGLAAWDSFAFHQVDLLDAPLGQLLDGADLVFHLAGQPGVMCTVGASAWTGVANIGGGSRTSMAEVIRMVGSLVGRTVEALRLPTQPRCLAGSQLCDVATRNGQQ
jgi:GDP-D-mannose dehydratase